MVVACLVKEIQICTELRKMAEMGLIQSEVVRLHKIWQIDGDKILDMELLCNVGHRWCQGPVWFLQLKLFISSKSKQKNQTHNLLSTGRRPCEAEVWVPPARRGGPGRAPDEGGVHGDAGADAGAAGGKRGQGEGEHLALYLICQ